MEKFTTSLKNLGFSEIEIAIYSALMKLGEASYADLAKAAGVKRTSLYGMIATLQERGIVRYNPEKRTLSPITPRNLFSQLQSELLKFHKFIPQLESLGGQARAISRLNVYRGAKGIKQAMLEPETIIAPEKKRWRYIISDAQTWNSFWREADTEFLNNFPRKAKEAGYKTKVLFSGRKEKPFNKSNIPDFEMQTKFLPKSYQTTFDLEIRPSQIIISDIKSDQPYAIKIISTELAQALAGFFEYTWSLSK